MFVCSRRSNQSGQVANITSSSQATPSTQRWVPPKKREKLPHNEIVFRRIRGLLNKLTPDNFEKLVSDISHYIANDDRDTLKGAILLVFDKAVDESSYSSMYAQLCVRLNDVAPNFEEPSSSTTTFRRLLLAKCKEEFEKRTNATAAFDKQDDLTVEDEEQRGVAKRKMLGNIKFIGELFKLGVLHEAIVHQCIKELLDKRKNLVDVCENVECLCHLLTTVGRKLDTQKAKGWMNKYFERMATLTQSENLPPRNKFLLMNVIELRDNQWIPRKSKIENGPKPLERSPQISYRPHAPPPKSYSHSHNKVGQPMSQTKSVCSKQELDKQDLQTGYNQDNSQEINLRKFPSGKKSDSSVSLRPSMPSRKFQHLKPTEEKTPPPLSDTPPLSDNESHSIPRTRDDSSDDETQPIIRHLTPPTANITSPHPVMPFMRPPIPYQHPPQSHPMLPLPRGMPFPPVHMIPMGMHPPHYPQPPFYRPMPPPPARPPFFLGPYPPPHWPHHHLSQPPPPLAAAPLLNTHSDNDSLMPFRDLKETQPIKRSGKSGKKGTTTGGRKVEPTKDEQVVLPLIQRYLATHDITGVADIIIKLSNISPTNVITIFMTKTINNSEDSRCEVSFLFDELHKQEYLTSNMFIKAGGQVLASLSTSDTTYPLARNAIAGYLARAVSQGLSSLSEVSSLFTDGAYHPTVLIVLQAVTNLIGRDGIQTQFQNEGIMMTSLLPASHRSYDAVSQLLETRNLGFLYPLKHIQSELKSLLKRSDVTALSVYKWLKTNVDHKLFKNPELVMLLTKSILGHVTKQSIANLTKESLTNEKTLMQEYKLIIQKLVHDDTSLQMVVIYATQVFSHDMNFPKGLLLRLFSYWYEMDVVEEEVLLQWREDPSDQYPGKGRALFQVNQWLMMLAEAEEEEEEEEDDDI